MTRHSEVDTDFGPITVVATGNAISGLYFDGHAHRPDAASFGVRVDAGDDPLLTEAAEQLIDYLDDRRVAFDLPLVADGDAFQKKVWAILAGIPRGTTTTYGAIAEALGDKSMARRVGQAVGANPLCIVVPCHRVVGADGSLTGYAGGLERKQALLMLEDADARALF